MFAQQGKEPIFIETVSDVRRNRHTFLECIPLPPELASEASAYFKKAIMEADTQWTQNPRLIDTRKKELRRSIPANFPYFHVEFGVSGGFAHVIEDSALFPRQFGHEVLAGMLELPPSVLRQEKQDETTQRAQVKSFLQTWAPFDWTVMLEGICDTHLIHVVLIMSQVESTRTQHCKQREQLSKQKDDRSNSAGETIMNVFKE